MATYLLFFFGTILPSIPLLPPGNHTALICSGYVCRLWWCYDFFVVHSILMMMCIRWFCSYVYSERRCRYIAFTDDGALSSFSDDVSIYALKVQLFTRGSARLCYYGSGSGSGSGASALTWTGVVCSWYLGVSFPFDICFDLGCSLTNVAWASDWTLAWASTST